MGDLGLRFLGKNQEGLAQAIELSNNNNLLVANNTRILINQSFKCTRDGFHVWGKTVGRGHNPIFDISDISSLSVEVIVSGSIAPDSLSLLLFTANDRFTSGDTPRTDPDCMDIIPITNKVGNKYVLTPEDIGNVTRYIGMIVLANMKVDCNINVKVLGSSNANAQGKRLISNNDYLSVTNNTKTLINKSFTCVTDGFHVWAKTVGRGHNQIFDISDISSLSVEVTVSSTVKPSNIDLLLFTDNNRFTSGATPRVDPDCMEIIPITAKVGNKYVLTPEDIGNVTRYIGMAVVADMKVGCNTTVKVLGSSNAAGQGKRLISKNDNLNVANNTKILVNERFKCVTTGFHIFGETSGRGHNVIYDISDINSLSVEVTVNSGVKPGRMDLLLFTDNNRFTTGESPRLDPDCSKIVTIVDKDTNGRYILTPEDIGDITHYIGMVIVINMEVNCDVSVKVLGSPCGIDYRERFELLCDEEITFAAKNEVKKLSRVLPAMAKRLKVVVYKKSTIQVKVAYFEGFDDSIYASRYWNGTCWTEGESTTTILPTQANIEEKIYHLNSAMTGLDDPAQHIEFRLTALEEPDENNILKIKVWGEF